MKLPRRAALLLAVSLSAVAALAQSSNVELAPPYPATLLKEALASTNPPTITGTMGRANSLDQTAMKVSGKVRFFSAPKGPYKIVCSFIVYQKMQKSYFIANEAEVEVSGSDAAFELSGALPPPRPGLTVRITQDDLINEWYIRVISDGKLVGVQASRAAVADFFKKNPGELETNYIRKLRTENAAKATPAPSAPAALQ